MPIHTKGNRLVINRVHFPMSSNAHLFKGTDLTRAVKAVRKAGERNARIEIERTGKLVVILGEPDKAKPADEEVNEWDRT
jgi:hypothetical protein